MPSLRLSCLQSVQVWLDKQPLTHFPRAKALALLIFLAVEQDHPHRREALATLLWPDSPESRARRNLSQTLMDLRRTDACLSTASILAVGSLGALQPEVGDGHYMGRLLMGGHRCVLISTHHHLASWHKDIFSAVCRVAPDGASIDIQWRMVFSQQWRRHRRWSWQERGGKYERRRGLSYRRHHRGCGRCGRRILTQSI